MFGEDAELYDRARPGYSDDVVSSVLGYLAAGRASGERDGDTGDAGDTDALDTVIDPSALTALEIGAGTGKATEAFARRGVPVLALEPDPAMAAVAARRTLAFPSVRIEQAAFEDWPVDAGSVDLVFSGQAWHWVRPEVRGPKAAGALRPDGVLALFWHRPDWPEDDPVRAALDACYVEHAPGLRARGPSFPGLGPMPDRREREEIADSSLFTDVVARHHPWASESTTDDYLDLLATQSDHRLLPDEDRRRLLNAVRAVIDELGESIRVPYDTLLVLARPARPAR